MRTRTPSKAKDVTLWVRSYGRSFRLYLQHSCYAIDDRLRTWGRSNSGSWVCYQTEQWAVPLD